MELTEKKCKPCEGGMPPLTEEEVKQYRKEVNTKWEVVEGGKKIRREFVFKDFMEAMKFVNKVAVVAEADDHHPDIHIHYRRVILELWTHAIGGLSENDFIIAAKIDAIQ